MTNQPTSGPWPAEAHPWPARVQPAPAPASGPLPTWMREATNLTAAQLAEADPHALADLVAKLAAEARTWESWAAALDSEALGDRLRLLAIEGRSFGPMIRRAILVEAARRLGATGGELPA